MNPNYIHTITLYNRIRAADAADKKEHWQRTVLPECFYKEQTNIGFSDKQVSVSGTYTVRIPRSERYLPYAKFCKRPQGHFTMSLGDVVVYGTCNEEITGLSGYTAAELLQRHKPNAFKITSATDNTIHRMSKHYRLGG